MTLRAPTPRRIVLGAVRPNLGVRAAYKRRLTALIDAMHRDVLRTLARVYRVKPPHALMAKDESPAAALRKAMHDLVREWSKKFSEGADRIAAHFAGDVLRHSSLSLKHVLRKAGFAVKFQMTRPANDAYRAVIGENVALIKSIPAQHLSEVEGMVMRSVQHGRSMAELTGDLQARYSITKRRAALIARDQNNKATAVLDKVRKLDLGITKSVWVHTLASKQPRESHEQMNGQTYDTAAGCYDDEEGREVQPGELINCLPGNSPIEFTTGCHVLWKRRYSGELTRLVTASGKAVEATPNHPVLTTRGWIPIHAVNLADYVLSVPQQTLDRLKVNVEGRIPTVAELFEALASYIVPTHAAVSKLEFHGDVTDSEVDVVDADRFLPNEIDATHAKAFCELLFPCAKEILGGIGLPADGMLVTACNRLFGAPESVVCGASLLLPLLNGHGAHDQARGLRGIAWLDSLLKQASANDSSVYSVALGKLKLTRTGLVRGDNQIIGELINALSRASSCWYPDTPSADVLGDRTRLETDLRGGAPDRVPSREECNRVVDKQRVYFDGHVFNLKTVGGWYSSNTCIAHNCGCVSRGIIPGLEDDEDEGVADEAA